MRTLVGAGVPGRHRGLHERTQPAPHEVLKDSAATSFGFCRYSTEAQPDGVPAHFTNLRRRRPPSP
jgi:hypothetical protein